MKVTLVVDRVGTLLCRSADRAKLPEVGQAFTIEDEDDEPTHASSVLAVASAPNRRRWCMAVLGRITRMIPS
ncbi:MAG: hypothetical protein ACRDFR_04425 [Candidatus Limnocylindria bacterium]